MTTDNDKKDKNFDDNDETIVPKNKPVGYNQIVDALFGPPNYLRRSEMSNMPVGNKAFQMAIVMTRQRVQAALIKGEDYDVMELLLDCFAIVKRAEKGWLGEKAVEMKALESEKDNQIIKQMSSEG
jgi:hypothetical protein